MTSSSSYRKSKKPRGLGLKGYHHRFPPIKENRLSSQNIIKCSLKKPTGPFNQDYLRIEDNRSNFPKINKQRIKRFSQTPRPPQRKQVFIQNMIVFSNSRPVGFLIEQQQIITKKIVSQFRRSYKTQKLETPNKRILQQLWIFFSCNKKNLGHFNKSYVELRLEPSMPQALLEFLQVFCQRSPRLLLGLVVAKH